jgi:hypothetical protein
MKIKVSAVETGRKPVKSLTQREANALAREAGIQMQSTKIVEGLKKLFSAREKYETETLARSNKELYGILGETHDLFKAAEKDNCLPETVKQLRTELDKRGVRVQSNTPALTVFVRYVFNSDRKRAYNYTRTLMAVIAHKSDSETLAEYVERNHGVEECKRQINKKPETIKKEADLKAAEQDVLEILDEMLAVETVKIPKSSVDLSDGSYAFLLARTSIGGTFEVLRAVPKTTRAMENAAIRELAKHLLIEREESAKKAKVTKTVRATAKALSTMSVKEVEAMAM